VRGGECGSESERRETTTSAKISACIYRYLNTLNNDTTFDS
jgi:hypothetical protein